MDWLITFLTNISTIWMSLAQELRWTIMAFVFAGIGAYFKHVIDDNTARAAIATAERQLYLTLVEKRVAWIEEVGEIVRSAINRPSTGELSLAHGGVGLALYSDMNAKRRTASWLFGPEVQEHFNRMMSSTSHHSSLIKKLKSVDMATALVVQNQLQTSWSEIAVQLSDLMAMVGRYVYVGDIVGQGSKLPRLSWWKTVWSYALALFSSRKSA